MRHVAKALPPMTRGLRTEQQQSSQNGLRVLGLFASMVSLWRIGSSEKNCEYELTDDSDAEGDNEY